jgi:hypothetical protein
MKPPSTAFEAPKDENIKNSGGKSKRQTTVDKKSPDEAQSSNAKPQDVKDIRKSGVSVSTEYLYPLK